MRARQKPGTPGVREGEAQSSAAGERGARYDRRRAALVAFLPHKRGLLGSQALAPGLPGAEQGADPEAEAAGPGRVRAAATPSLPRRLRP